MDVVGTLSDAFRKNHPSLGPGIRPVQELEQELALLPPDSTAAYFKALQQPTLVLFDSDPLAFLEFHNGDATAAARRLASYWAVREHVFQEKAFEPLCWASDTSLVRVLTQDHYDELQSQTIMPLGSDAEGHSVLVVDRARRVSSPRNILVQKQALFYLLSYCSRLLSSSRPDKTPPPSLVLVFSISTRASFQNPCNAMIIEWIRVAFPFRLHHIHVAGCPPIKAVLPLFEDGAVRPAVQSLGSYAKPLTVHVEDSKQQLLLKLQRAGLQELNLPQSLGGTGDSQHFFDWLSVQVKFDLATASVGREDTTIVSGQPVVSQYAVAVEDADKKPGVDPSAATLQQDSPQTRDSGVFEQQQRSSNNGSLHDENAEALVLQNLLRRQQQLLQQQLSFAMGNSVDLAGADVDLPWSPTTPGLQASAAPFQTSLDASSLINPGTGLVGNYEAQSRGSKHGESVAFGR